MKTMMGGKGGYGGITTMNTDQREGRYKPHNSIVLYTRYSDNITEVSCLGCGQKWEHARGHRADTPQICEPGIVNGPAAEEGSEIIFESYVTEDNKVRCRPKVDPEC